MLLFGIWGDPSFMGPINAYFTYLTPTSCKLTNYLETCENLKYLKISETLISCLFT